MREGRPLGGYRLNISLFFSYKMPNLFFFITDLSSPRKKHQIVLLMKRKMDPEDWIDESFLDPALLNPSAGTPQDRHQASSERFTRMIGQKKPKYTPEAYEYIKEDTRPAQLPMNYRNRINRLSREGERDPAELEEMESLLIEAEEQGWMSREEIRRVRLQVDPESLKAPGPLPKFEETTHRESGMGRKPRKNRHRLPIQSFQHNRKIKVDRSLAPHIRAETEQTHGLDEEFETYIHADSKRESVQRHRREPIPGGRPGVSRAPYTHRVPLGEVSLRKMVHELVRAEVSKLQVDYNMEHRPDIYLRETKAPSKTPLGGPATHIDTGVFGNPSLRDVVPVTSTLLGPTPVLDETPAGDTFTREKQNIETKRWVDSITAELDVTPSLVPSIPSKNTIEVHRRDVGTNLDVNTTQSPLMREAEPLMEETPAPEWEFDFSTTPNPTLSPADPLIQDTPAPEWEFDFSATPKPTLAAAQPLIQDTPAPEWELDLNPRQNPTMGPVKPVIETTPRPEWHVDFTRLEDPILPPAPSLVKPAPNLTPSFQNISSHQVTSEQIPRPNPPPLHPRTQMVSTTQNETGDSSILLRPEHTITPVLGRGEVHESGLHSVPSSLKRKEPVYATRSEIEKEKKGETPRQWKTDYVGPAKEPVSTEPVQQLISKFDQEHQQGTPHYVPSSRPIDFQTQSEPTVSRNLEENPDILKIGDATDSEVESDVELT